MRNEKVCPLATGTLNPETVNVFMAVFLYINADEFKSVRVVQPSVE